MHAAAAEEFKEETDLNTGSTSQLLYVQVYRGSAGILAGRQTLTLWLM